jgi:hypothetical protein
MTTESRIDAPNSYSNPTCTCYVLGLSAEAQFSLHYGAHALDCPTYRPSRDPVDRCNDDRYRIVHGARRWATADARATAIRRALTAL